MAVFNVPVVIGVDEVKIAKEIEKDVTNQVIANITEEIKDILYTKYTYTGKTTDEPLRQMVRTEVINVIKDREDIILDSAAKYLAEKMAKTKAVKEAINKTIEEFNKDI